MFNIFKDKNVIVTGHTGFKGSWLSAWLRQLGAKVTGISLDEVSVPSHFVVTELAKMVQDHRQDIRDSRAMRTLVKEAHPDFVFHLAAQPLVRSAYKDPLTTYQTNVFGTLNLLEGLRDLKKKCTAVLITSDKCYDNVEWIWGYRETDRLGGHDPYSASKGAAELVIHSHVKSFFEKDGPVRIAVARAGNVIGGGDWATDRIVPDCVSAWAKKQTVKLRNPHATRPWQHVLEPLRGYLRLAAELHHRQELHGEPFNFGPLTHDSHTVLELVEEMSYHWSAVSFEDVSEMESGPHESGLLKLNCDKALNLLDWKAVLSFKETVRMTANWYRAYYRKPNTIRDITFAQIQEYETLVK